MIRSASCVSSKRRAASALNHPNIITIYDIGQVDSTHYIASEYVEGKTLRRHLCEQKLSLEEALTLTIHVANALAAAHAAGIVHRDIKPENLMIRPDGYVKVLDFGLAKLTEGIISAQETVSQETLSLMEPLVRTEPSVILGTPSYMSPEQARGLEVDSRTDLFSLGVVLYEMLTTERPFDGATFADVVAALLKKEPEPLTQHKLKTPAKLQQIVSKALCKDIGGRYQSAEELIKDLRACRRELEPATKTESYESPNFKEVENPTANRTLSFANAASTSSGLGIWRGKYVLLTLLVILLAGIGLGLWYLANRPATDSLHSIAVLPFKPLVADSRDESLEMGMADTLITRLSGIKQLNVRPLSAVRKYSGLEQDALAAGREQRADVVLDGSIQRAGERIRVTVRLVSTADGQPVWAEQFDERFTDILTLEDSISRQVAAALTVKLTGSEKQLLTKHYTENPEAHSLYLKGRYFWNKRTPEAIKKSIESFNQAIEKDPGYALAYVGLADAYLILIASPEAQPKEVLSKAKQAAQEALNIDHQLPEAHTTLAGIADFEWNWPEAESQFKQALEMNSNYATAHQWYGEYLDHAGRSDEAIRELQRAQELDPLSLVMNSALAQAYYHSRQYDLSIVQFQKTLDLDPNFVNAHLHLGLVYLQKKMYGDALAEFQKALQLTGGVSQLIALVGATHAMAGNRGEAQKVLDTLNKMSKQGHTKPDDFAIIYIGLGDKDRALEWLTRAYEDHSFLVPLFKVDPYFDPLRSDPRFQDLLRQIGL